VIVADDLEQLAELAALEAERHAARTAGRRVASHLWVALTVPPAASLDAAHRAIRSFGDNQTQAAALELLERIAAGRATK
jgi:hypothetical protein